MVWEVCGLVGVGYGDLIIYAVRYHCSTISVNGGLFQETCLLFKSPTISTESFWAKIWSRSAVERGDDGGWYAATNNSLEVF